MTDEKDKNVVDIFSAHKKSKKVKSASPVKKCSGKNVCQNSEGYYYVAKETDERGRHFDEKDLLGRAEAYYYLIKVMVKEGARVQVRDYKVPAEDLMKFLKLYTDGRGEGQVLEIDKFFQEDWA